jgi:hypothetical protein
MDLNTGGGQARSCQHNSPRRGAPTLYLLGAVSSLIAAVWWYRASQVEAPGELRGDVGYRGPAVEYARESGRRNKIAALWSAAAALFTGLTWFVRWGG